MKKILNNIWLFLIAAVGVLVYFFKDNRCGAIEIYKKDAEQEAKIKELEKEIEERRENIKKLERAMRTLEVSEDWHTKVKK